MRECRYLCKVFYFTIEFDIVTVWLRSEYGSTTFIQWVTDISFTASTSTFLTMQLAACTMYFSTGLHFVSSLPLGAEILLNSKINHMIVWFSTEDLVGQFNRPACFLSLYI